MQLESVNTRRQVAGISRSDKSPYVTSLVSCENAVALTKYCPCDLTCEFKQVLLRFSVSPRMYSQATYPRDNIKTLTNRKASFNAFQFWVMAHFFGTIQAWAYSEKTVIVYFPTYSIFRMNGINRIWFTWNTQSPKFLYEIPARPAKPVTWHRKSCSSMLDPDYN